METYFFPALSGHLQFGHHALFARWGTPGFVYAPPRGIFWTSWIHKNRKKDDRRWKTCLCFSGFSIRSKHPTFGGWQSDHETRWGHHFFAQRHHAKVLVWVRFRNNAKNGKFGINKLNEFNKRNMKVYLAAVNCCSYGFHANEISYMEETMLENERLRFSRQTVVFQQKTRVSLVKQGGFWESWIFCGFRLVFQDVINKIHSQAKLAMATN